MNPRNKPMTSTGPSPAELLAKMPRRPMTPEQQQEALAKVQQQATQRVKLGQQLFEAAEARLKQHQEVLKEIQDQQQILREQVQEDVAKSLQSYDQWMGQIDESFTGAIREMNQRIDNLELRVDASRGEMESMIAKATGLLEQTQSLFAEAFDEEALHAVADAMQHSVPEDPHCDIDSFEQPPMDTNATGDYADADQEVIEVEIVEPGTMSHQSMPIDEEPQRDGEGDDVFGEVLRRLRSRPDDDDDA